MSDTLIFSFQDALYRNGFIGEDLYTEEGLAMLYFVVTMPYIAEADGDGAALRIRSLYEGFKAGGEVGMVEADKIYKLFQATSLR